MTEPQNATLHACPCGRSFAKAFGMRIHQRTCTAPTLTAFAAAEALLAATPDADPVGQSLALDACR